MDGIPASLRALAVPTAELRPYARNARLGDTDAIAESLRFHGQYRPVVANKRTGEVLAGNHTYAAALELGWDQLAVTWVDVDDEQAARIVLVDNKSNDKAGYDNGLLAELLKDLPGLEGTGWDQQELDDLLASLIELPPVPSDPDDVPELPASPLSEPGDVWLLGPHKVGCGDSTDPNVWESLLQGARPDVVFTDPPYGIGYQAMRGGRAIENDADPDQAERVTRDALALLHDATVHFVCCDWRSLPTILDAMTAAALEPKSCIVWDKGSRVQNLDRYAKQHEFVVYAGPFGGQPTACTDVWSHPRDFKPDHPTPKPVSLIEQALSTASGPGDLVADPFGGSGSTLIACYTQGRVARLVELDPRYVDVICRRYQEVSGDKPILESTGEPHDFTRG